MKERMQEGRPESNRSRVEGKGDRPQRVPVSGNRDILTVAGQDKAYVYRWVLDASENGGEVYKFKQAGYEFVQKNERLGIGQDKIFTSDDLGSIYRRPDGAGKYLYLMRVKREWYEEDQAAKQAAIDEVDDVITRRRSAESDDGQYGQNKLDTGKKVRNPLGL